MNSKTKNILIINGSLGGAYGNTSHLINVAQKFLDQNHIGHEILHLAELPNIFTDNLVSKFISADGFIFTSGTYWDSWGSPMQAFLEKATQYEASEIFLYKPASVLITMHSVGGKGVLSRLQGVLNTLGMAIPPMSGLVYALSTHLVANSLENSFHDDFWTLNDIEVIIHNLVTAVNKGHDFKSWQIDRKDPFRIWF